MVEKVALHYTLLTGGAARHAGRRQLMLWRQASVEGPPHLACRGVPGGRLVDREVGVRLRQPDGTAVEHLEIGARRVGPTKPRRWHCRRRDTISLGGPAADPLALTQKCRECIVKLGVWPW